ncbi:MAG TPA: hypothetical protein VN114_05125 [Oxalicibacterium sp.]|uniref:hypothetical protein n=1 Tax=Oxalicibacterium sp. TaxID=2766525 RepID=UPI002C930C37|nr:hypothetical protein [Oxalicibacterium sp.]HWU97872.1 hypothetical protein [Oxalicibacterium sp.]
MSVDGKQHAGDIDAKVGALRYLMVMLLQRLDADGRIDMAELMSGVRADQLPSIPPHRITLSSARYSAKRWIFFNSLLTSARTEKSSPHRHRCRFLQWQRW